ncbi:organic solute transport protein 1-domain-containing protein [Haematococcus lacustris]
MCLAAHVPRTRVHVCVGHRAKRSVTNMSLLAMPLLYINLGVEMVYILDQRLRAQEIPPDKGERVLNDVVRKMFDKDCIDKLFVPCELYSTSAVRKCMDALAHSSIMRLSETSMDKLFDLMMMGVKYQIMCSTKLEGILQITLLHLSQLRSLLAPLADSSASLALLSNVEARVQQTYGGLGPGALHLLRQSLMRYFLDRRVKVSLFLQEGIQSTTGRWILPSPSSPYAGTITYYDGQGGLELQEKLKLKALEGLDPQEFYIHPAPLGSNLYNKDRPKVVPPPRKGDALQAPPGPWDDMGLAGEGKAQVGRSTPPM